MKKLEVVAGIIKYDDKILCTQRDLDKHGYVSFMWEFPGGKIEPNETQTEALKRELMEELNMNVNVDKYFCSTTYTYPTLEIKMHCYICSVTDSAITLNVHKSYKWLSLSDLKSLNWAYADREVVDKLMAYAK